MGKLVRTNTVYIWPKDSENACDYTYSALTEEEYKELCDEYGVETMEGYFDNGESVEEIEASEDSYSSQGEYNEVCNIPDDKVEEIQKIIDEMDSLRNKLKHFF